MTQQTDNASETAGGLRALRVFAMHPNATLLNGMERVLESFTASIADIQEAVTFRMESFAALAAVEERVAAATPDILLVAADPSDTELFRLPGSLTAKGDDMPIILITQTASVQAAVNATKEGAFDFLLQPFTPAAFRHTVCRAARHVLLAQRARELEAERKRVRFDFIRVLGHELKAPLGAVTTNIELFTGRHLGADIATYDRPMERCKVRLEQMRKLIIDLLDMTRLESGQKTRELTPTDLTEAVRDAVELMTPQAHERGIRIDVDMPDSVVVEADRGEIDMILNNLVSNAVKYNRDDGRITVTLEPVDGGVSIAVRDTGIGMTPAEVAKLFGEFVRIRNRKTANILGSGLGLSILKRLAELYNGRVDVESVPDEGTTFRVHLLPGQRQDDETATVASAQ